MSERNEHDDRHVLPVGNRRDDPPAKHWRWRVGLAVAKYPVQAAILLALIVLTVPIVMLVSSNGELRASNQRVREATESLRTSNSDLKQALLVMSTSRKVTSAALCTVVNENGRANNGQNAKLKSIIIDSAKSSRAFEATYRRLGLPPYSERLKEAERIAHELDTYTVKPANCEALAAQIERDVQSVLGVRTARGG